MTDIEKARIEAGEAIVATRSIFLKMSKEQQLRTLRRVWTEHHRFYEAVTLWALEAPIGRGGIPAEEIEDLSMELMEDQ